MPKTIKLELATYQRLDIVRTKSETFSQAVERLLDVASLLKLAATKIGMAQPLPLE